MRVIISLCTMALLVSCGVSKKTSDSEPITHEIWDSLLQDYVDEEGWVDYAGLRSDSARLNLYLDLLASAHPNDKRWNKDEQLAYWINAYNAFTIKLITRHYPIASIKDIKRGIPFVNTVWDIKFIEIEGHLYDLNNIEHGIIRKYFDEPRIHFAVNCASVSCPRLSNRAYTAESLDQQLTEAAKSFLSDPLRNRVSEGQVSSIFSWFKGDFTREGSLIDFINRYSAAQIPTDSKLTFLDYDWRLNVASNK